MWGKSQLMVSCFSCGLRKYGPDAEKIVKAAEVAEAEYQRRLDADRQARVEAERAARLEAERLEAERLAQQLAQQLEQQRIEAENCKKQLALQLLFERRWKEAEMRRAALAQARADYLATGADPFTVCGSPWCTKPRVGKKQYCSDKCADDLPRYKYVLRKKGLTYDK
jgi:predicted  nucleic acid-binding Zn-ribbon protein